MDMGVGHGVSVFSEEPGRYFVHLDSPDNCPYWDNHKVEHLKLLLKAWDGLKCQRSMCDTLR